MDLNPANPDREVTMHSYCGPDQLETLEAYVVLGKGDTAAVIGLVSRGKLMALEPGNQVHLVATEGKLARVRIVSGFHIGERCWVPTGLLR